MELLAPAGSLEHFTAAVEAGADSVYVGAPGFNARNPSREFRVDEIRAMASYCKDHRLSFYIALNSLVREDEITRLIKVLAELESIAPTALIVQDLGVIKLARDYFPSLSLHGSTLMFAHNSAGVRTLSELGCSRVVLARELTIPEIGKIVNQSPVELEIFIHGAMCYSYSGGCLFSSYHGGKSGLRGNCVQPCRRKYSVTSSKTKSKGKGGRSAYLFSMNDLEGIDLVDEFKRIGIASLKIEGRLRSVNYVEQVVRAYRMVMDARSSELEEVRHEAKKLVKSALGRKSSTGFFLDQKSKDVVASHHSGNIGTYLGRFRKIIKEENEYWGYITPNDHLQAGERFRLHGEASGERVSFTGKQATRVSANEYHLLLPPSMKAQLVRDMVSLYRVDVKNRHSSEANPARESLQPVRSGSFEAASIKKKTQKVSTLLGHSSNSHIDSQERNRGRKSARNSTELWVRLDSTRMVFQKLPFKVDKYVLPIEKRTLAETGQLKKYFGRQKNRVIWALPPVVHERAIFGLKKNIDVLLKSGFGTFQIGSLGQLHLLKHLKATIYADYTINVLNSMAMAMAADLGLSGFQFSIETDRQSLMNGLNGYRDLEVSKKHQKRERRKEPLRMPVVGLTVYGAPPLFISRAGSEQLPHNQKVVSPRGEQFVMTKKGEHSYTRPVKPFSLLQFRNELERMGLDYMVVDLSGMRTGKKDFEELAARLSAKERLPKLPTFNYVGTLE